ncbi:MAG: hydrogenase nickel incorporation protein HypB, partial [Acetobacteraceae bacterium]
HGGSLMCSTCGCGETADVLYTDPATGAHEHSHGGHVHSHEHDNHVHSHEHAHPHDHARTKTIALEQDVLAKNQRAAERNRGWFAGRDVVAINLMSSPGAGKTSILERTIRYLANSPPVCVIEGDQATLNDAERIRAAGAPALQINTGTGCHLDAEMVARAARQLDPRAGTLLLIENVGNLVCPALFDLGENAKVVIVSVTEGEDKPSKYPHMFRAAQVMVMNKIDLLPHVRFDPERCIALARQINSGLSVFPLSAETGEGTGAWYAWLRDQARAARDSAQVSSAPPPVSRLRISANRMIAP